MIRDDFLQQNSYTEYDRVSPMWKTFWMLKNMLHFYDLAKRELNDAAASDKRVTFEAIANFMAPQIQRLIQMKFICPKDGEEECTRQLQALYTEIEDRFRSYAD
jgi:V-type H+-transporting ATPase subunit A